MTDLWTKLKQRKLVQWVAAYVAFAFALLQGIDLVAQPFGWPASVLRLAILVLAVGFILALLLAWYHGEQGRQRVSGTELMIITLVLVFGGVLLWFVGRSATPTAMPATPVTSKPIASTASASSVAHKPSPPATSAAITAKSIAVLPFENLSADKNNAYFANGMQDLILTKLADIGQLKVISRTSTAKYASHPDDLKTIAQQLGVANILEGSVQKAGDQVLINVQLINAQTDAHIWAQAYTRTLDNVFGVEGEVADKIADSLKTKLTPTESKQLGTALSTDPRANDLYLRAEYYFNHTTSLADLPMARRAVTSFKQAIARVPDFALARAHLSHVESWLAWHGGAGDDISQLEADAHAQAERSLQLAPDLADAHLAMGYYEYYVKGNYDAALKSFATALRIRPNDADAYAAQGYVLRRHRRFNEAIDAFKQSLVLDPRSSLVAMMLGETYQAVGKYGEAETALRRALALDPGNDFARNAYASVILSRSGDLNRALAEAQGDGDRSKMARTFYLTMQHKYAAAIELLRTIPDTAFLAFPGTKDVLFALIYQFSGNATQARSHYAKALPLLRARLPLESGHPGAVAVLWARIGTTQIGLGNKDAGISAIKASLEASRKTSDYLMQSSIIRFAAENYAQAGMADKAVSLLEQKFSTPGGLSDYAPSMLWLDPVWDPIRKAPEFQALLKKYADKKPAVIPSESGDG